MNARDVFSKVGDSNSFSTNFLVPLGAVNYASSNWSNLGSYTSLKNTVAYFRDQGVDSQNANSFSHASVATYGGWSSTNLLTPGLRRALNAGRPVDALLPPLEANIQETRPAIALVMIGTCEVGSDDTQTYEENSTTMTTYLLSQGSILVLSTIPYIKLSPNPTLVTRVREYNQIISRRRGRHKQRPALELVGGTEFFAEPGGLGSERELTSSAGPNGKGDFATTILLTA